MNYYLLGAGLIFAALVAGTWEINREAAELHLRARWVRFTFVVAAASGLSFAALWLSKDPAEAMLRVWMRALGAAVLAYWGVAGLALAPKTPRIGRFLRGKLFVSR